MTELPNRHKPVRFEQLDALRGVAALAVMIGHVLRSSGAWLDQHFFRVADRTPLHAFVAGREAVLLFFVLSGFVLALPFLSGRGRSYGSYAIRRVFRIYIPYLVAAAAGFAGFLLLARGDIPGMSDWFDLHWHRPVTSDKVAAHVAMVGRFRSSEYGLSFWSIIHEMRISLVFPLLMIPVLSLRTRWAAAIGAAFSIIGVGLLFAAGQKVGDGSVEYAVTVHLLGIFMFGALIAKHRDLITERISSLTAPGRWMLVIAAAFLYLQARWVTDLFGENAIAQGAEHWLIAMGAAAFITILMASARAARAFTVRPLLFLGRISYSLYLFHAIVLYAMVHGLSPYLPLWSILASVPVVAIVVATLSARYVEDPAMQIGRSLAARWEGRRRPVAVSPRGFERAIDRAKFGGGFDAVGYHSAF